jgi:hypothetical protein
MSQKIQIDNENNAVLLFNKEKHKWEDRIISIQMIFPASYYRKFTGYNIYFKGANKKFFYKKESVQVLNKVKNINIEKQDVFVEPEK